MVCGSIVGASLEHLQMYKYVGPDFDSTGVNQYEFGTVFKR